MKLLSQEEEQEHYNATLKGGIAGGLGGLTVGTLGVVAATRRYPAFRNLTLPFRAFLIASSGSFASIVTADHFARAYERERNPEANYQNTQETLQQELQAQKPFGERAQQWLSEHRYPIVFGSWVASMGIALGLVGRNPYLTGQQKLVQARVYAQGLTVAVLIASFAFEASDANKGKGRWETVKVIDPNDPEHKHIIEKKIHHERYAGEDQWRDVVEAEERRMKRREELKKQREEKKQKESSNDESKKANESGNAESKQQKEPEKGDSKKQKGAETSESKKGGGKVEPAGAGGSVPKSAQPSTPTFPGTEIMSATPDINKSGNPQGRENTKAGDGGPKKESGKSSEKK